MILIIFFFQLLATSSAQQSPAFQEQTVDSTISIGYGIALGDVDGDKRPDILLADKKQVVWYRNGDWKKFVMAENLTEFDNVCIAAEDLDGDGKVEVAVGAQWNPSETKDSLKSGSVHFLIRPNDPTAMWRAVNLYHEVTIHRMRWVKTSTGLSYLLVLPLHGKENSNGEGRAVNLLVFKYPELLKKTAPEHIVSTNMHLTHNFDITGSGQPLIGLAGKEGVCFFEPAFKTLNSLTPLRMHEFQGAGEVRLSGAKTDKFVVTIEPMHGNKLVVYSDEGKIRMIIDTSLNEGHALAIADFPGTKNQHIVAGWRRPNKDGKVGIKLYKRKSPASTGWESSWIDENGMACEDLQVMDLNGDGKLDIVASGRATHNLKIYWNTGTSSK